MTKKVIMKRAHEIARTLEGNYIARLSYGLKQAWAEARQLFVQQGISGFTANRWSKNGNDRIYINDTHNKAVAYYDLVNMQLAVSDSWKKTFTVINNITSVTLQSKTYSLTLNLKAVKPVTGKVNYEYDPSMIGEPGIRNGMVPSMMYRY